VLLGLRAEAQLVDVVDDLAEVVAALDLVLDLTEDFADFVFNGVRPAGLLLEAVEVGEELVVDEVAQVVAGQGLVVVDVAVSILRGSPAFPAVGLVEDEALFLPLQGGVGSGEPHGLRPEDEEQTMTSTTGRAARLSH
jgi:hypothetical protein